MMQYVNYKEGIVQRYGVELIGWAHNKFTNPSDLSTAVEPLCKLLDAIKGGDCKFIKLTVKECKQCLETYRAKVRSGEVEVQSKKTHSNAGKKRKDRKVVHSESSEGSDSEGTVMDSGPSEKRKHWQIIKSSSTVQDDADSD